MKNSVIKDTGLSPWYWKQACHDDWSLRERCLHWGREVYNAAKMSAMCCSVCVEIAMLSVMLQCLYWCCEICDENMMSRFLCWGYYSALAMMNTLSLWTSILSLYEQLTTQKNIQKCKANRHSLAIIQTHNFPTSFSQLHNTLQIRFLQVGGTPANICKKRRENNEK